MNQHQPYSQKPSIAVIIQYSLSRGRLGVSDVLRAVWCPGVMTEALGCPGFGKLSILIREISLFRRHCGSYAPIGQCCPLWMWTAAIDDVSPERLLCSVMYRYTYLYVYKDAVTLFRALQGCYHLKSHECPHQSLNEWRPGEFCG